MQIGKRFNRGIVLLLIETCSTNKAMQAVMACIVVLTGNNPL